MSQLSSSQRRNLWGDPPGSRPTPPSALRRAAKLPGVLSSASAANPVRTPPAPTTTTSSASRQRCSTASPLERRLPLRLQLQRGLARRTAVNQFHGMDALRLAAVDEENQARHRQRAF